MKTFEAATQAMIDEDRENGHIGVDAPVWGRYENLLRAALLVVKQKTANRSLDDAISAVLKGDV